MRVGVVVLPEFSWPEGRGVWRRVEEMGFAHAWTYDHLSWRMFRDRAWYGAVPTLTAAAGVTERIRLGTLVASPNFRHPVSFARELVTLDDVAGGRFTLGFGAGSSGFDATALGGAAPSARERSGRFAEFVRMLDRLLVEQRLTYEGQYYAAEEARAYPGCVQRPRVPFYLAANGPRGLALTASVGDGWVAHADANLAELVGRFEEACAAAGRAPQELARLVVADSREEHPLASLGAFEDAAGRHAERGFTDMVVHWPRAEPPYQTDSRVIEQVAARLTDGTIGPPQKTP